MQVVTEFSPAVTEGLYFSPAPECFLCLVASMVIMGLVLAVEQLLTHKQYCADTWTASSRTKKLPLHLPTSVPFVNSFPEFTF
jgi:hypothetical protein